MAVLTSQIMQYVFERWRNHLVSSKDIDREVMKVLLLPRHLPLIRRCTNLIYSQPRYSRKSDCNLKRNGKVTRENCTPCSSRFSGLLRRSSNLSFTTPRGIASPTGRRSEN